MAHRYRLERMQLVRRPLADTFAFFANAENLEAITPPQLHFRILTPRPIAMANGALIDYQLRIYGFPVRWQSRIELFEPMRQFVDIQTRGPYRMWRHHHKFLEVDDGTLVVDEIDYEMPAGVIGRVAHALMIRRTLDQIFDYRRPKISELLEGRGG